MRTWCAATSPPNSSFHHSCVLPMTAPSPNLCAKMRKRIHHHTLRRTHPATRSKPWLSSETQQRPRALDPGTTTYTILALCRHTSEKNLQQVRLRNRRATAEYRNHQSCCIRHVHTRVTLSAQTNVAPTTVGRPAKTRWWQKGRSRGRILVTRISRRSAPTASCADTQTNGNRHA